MDETERKKPLPVGHSFFDRVVEDGFYYVDKTLFIKDLLDKNAGVTLCTRPRRFGKTLNQTMLKCFFEDNAPLPVPGGGARKDTRALFNGLKIGVAGERYLEHQGKYPVIFLSFKEGKYGSFDESYEGLRDCIAKEFRRHGYVAEKITDKYDRELFDKLSAPTGAIGDYSRSLKFLSECLENYHGKKAIILIDEYDVPLENAWSRGFYDEMINFIRPLLSSALKDNPHLQFAVITGCLRVSKESIFTGLNNLVVNTVLSNDYSGYFGFTQGEVDAMLDYYGFDGKRQIVRDWYNGYRFGNTEVYNPWSCLNVVSSWNTYINDYPRPYWINTSSNDIIHDMLDNMGADAKAGLETLMTGGTISVAVNEYVTYGDIYTSADNLWSFLLFTGYLKMAGEARQSEGRGLTVDLSVSNIELKYVYKNQIREWFNARVREKNLDALFSAVISGDVEMFQRELSSLLAENISFMDSSESFYHGVMLGVLARIDGYRLESEPESGDGRCDLALRGTNGKDGKVIIFEFKIAAKETGLQAVCEKALKQIEAKKYAAKWESHGYKNIVKYGIGFYKKRCRVMKGEKETVSNFV
ncbi:MAG: ATP-binding protein [Chitinispirillales bacterium]|jgi:hypothetical protein|nr:ATP-binding protein [Chitinispirillales bacterium]